MINPINIKQVIEVILEQTNKDLIVELKTYATNGNPHYGIDIHISNYKKFYSRPVFKKNDFSDYFNFVFSIEFNYDEILKVKNNEQLLILAMNKILIGLEMNNINLLAKNDIETNNALTNISNIRLFIENFLWNDFLNTGKVI